MKRLLVFILISINSVQAILACGPGSPYGEDVRYTLISEKLFSYADYERCFYTSYMYSGDWEYTEDDYAENRDKQINTTLWRKYCNNTIPEQVVYNAIYGSKEEVVSNSFLQYLEKHNQREALEYILFARTCSILNEEMYDPWERTEEAVLPQRDKMVQTALNRSKTVQDTQIKKRYAFLAIRLAHYNAKSEEVIKIYDTYFAGVKDKNIVDYWAMYFRAQAEKNSVYSNYLYAQVFKYSPEKRFSILLYYDLSVPAKEMLAYAKTNEERTMVLFMAELRSRSRSLESIKKLYTLDPSSEQLSFLLLREINKLEDWIYTPYYTAYDPVVHVSETQWYSGRLAKDRVYAQTVLSFLQSVNMKKVDRPEVWYTAKAYLLLMTKDYAGSIAVIDAVKDKKFISTQQKNLLLQLRAIGLTAQQAQGNAVVVNEIKPLLIQQANAGNRKFLFAVGRELEFKGNTSAAAVFYVHMNKGFEGEEEHFYYNGSPDQVYWLGKNVYQRDRDNYYSNYFDYLDGNYTISEVADLISAIEAPRGKDEFSNWFYKAMDKEIPRLYDLLGTKYVRINNLGMALRAYEKVNDTIWEEEFYTHRLDANPFYNNMYSEHEKSKYDTITFNKEELVRTLMLYIKYANDPLNKDRDYYYFLVANCYLNMTKNGNSWVMRHYFWTHGNTITKREDDQEYYCALLAKEHYMKAKEVTRDKKFAALSLRMAGRCEKYRLQFISQEGIYYEDYDEKIFKSNRYYSRLKKEFSNNYDELISNCESFETYFLERKATLRGQKGKTLL